ncbi:aspartate/glutamate racemase family protein [Hydrogenophaga sp.]|jgi:allantoin racemase|uniref:aspartate/glutamate racemase family protein n=1 Tax=Hydrogenophaga sp. TaxID=1904254 RepID=UPI003F6F259B
MRIWYQLLSSETGMKNFIAATQKLVDRIVFPGTTVEVRGTTQGVLGDQFRLFYNYDTREVIDNALRLRQQGGYDAFVLANSLDPALVELREMLNIPVVSFMEVNCFTACTMGDRFGLIVPNRKMIARYREIPIGYGLRDRLAAVEPLFFDDVRKQDDAFTDVALGDAVVKATTEAAKRAIAQGAEVLIAPGPPGALLAQRGIFEIDGVPMLDTYTLLAKAAETAVSMHQLTGVCVSRHMLYESPPAELVRKVAAAYQVDALRNG